MTLQCKFSTVAFLVSDWQRAKKFYGETLGMPVAAFMGDEVGWMEFGEKDGIHLAIRLWSQPEPIPQAAGGGTAIFSVPDTYKAVEELRSLGIQCEDIIIVPKMVAYANFYDPDGNRLQLIGPPSAN